MVNKAGCHPREATATASLVSGKYTRRNYTSSWMVPHCHVAWNGSAGAFVTHLTKQLIGWKNYFCLLNGESPFHGHLASCFQVYNEAECYGTRAYIGQSWSPHHAWEGERDRDMGRGVACASSLLLSFPFDPAGSPTYGTEMPKFTAGLCP